jgi:hypothetical protein
MCVWSVHVYLEARDPGARKQMARVCSSCCHDKGIFFTSEFEDDIYFDDPDN